MMLCDELVKPTRLWTRAEVAVQVARLVAGLHCLSFLASAKGSAPVLTSRNLGP